MFTALVMSPTAVKSQSIWATNCHCMLSSLFLLDVYDHDASHHVLTLEPDLTYKENHRNSE